MRNVDERRRVAVSAFSKWLTSPAGVKRMSSRSDKANQFVVAHEDEALGDVIERCHLYDPPVVMAVWFEKRKVFYFLEAKPVARRSPESKAAEDGVDPRSTVGMLAEYVKRNKSLTFKLTKWSSRLEVRTPELV